MCVFFSNEFVFLELSIDTTLIYIYIFIFIGNPLSFFFFLFKTHVLFALQDGSVRIVNGRSLTVVRTLRRTEKEEEEEISVLEIRVIASQMVESGGGGGEWEMRVLILYKNGDVCVWHMSGSGEEMLSNDVNVEKEERSGKSGGKWSLNSATKVATFSIPRRLLLQRGGSGSGHGTSTNRRGSSTVSSSSFSSSSSFTLDGYWFEIAARRMGTWTGSNQGKKKKKRRRKKKEEGRRRKIL